MSALPDRWITPEKDFYRCGRLHCWMCGKFMGVKIVRRYDKPQVVFQCRPCEVEDTVFLTQLTPMEVVLCQDNILRERTKLPCIA